MSIYEYKVKDAKGRTVPMANYRGKVLLIVNTAVNCGFAPQYEGLQALKKRFSAAVYAVDTFQILANAALLAVSSIFLVDATNNPFLYFRF